MSIRTRFAKITLAEWDSLREWLLKRGLPPGQMDLALGQRPGPGNPAPLRIDLVRQLISFLAQASKRPLEAPGPAQATPAPDPARVQASHPAAPQPPSPAQPAAAKAPARRPLQRRKSRR